MPSGIVRFVALVVAHFFCSGLALLLCVIDLMSAGPHWITTALCFTVLLPFTALECAGLGLGERSLLLALVVNSAISVGAFVAVRQAVRAVRGRRPSPLPGSRLDRAA